jgi:hypothetical protein
MSSSRITYTARPDATPEAKLDVFAACFRFILASHERRKAAPASRRMPDRRIRMLRATSAYPDNEGKQPSGCRPTQPERRGASRKRVRAWEGPRPCRLETLNG